MDHIAIMKKSWKLIPKILSGEKKIESRWYQTRRTPWGKIEVGDTVFFKDSGAPISARAVVSNVKQFTLSEISEVEKIVRRYGSEICLINKNPATWGKLPRYCILISLQNPQLIKPAFEVNKNGFGSGAAWITVKEINKIKL